MHSDEQLGIECLSLCSSDNDNCVDGCVGNSTCTIECASDQIECMYYCPCQDGCPSGCNGCETLFCEAVQCRDPESSPDFNECKERDLKLSVSHPSLKLLFFFLNLTKGVLRRAIHRLFQCLFSN